MRLRLQTKLLLLLAPLTIAPLLLLGWISYGQLKQTAEEKTLQQMYTLLLQLSHQIQDHLATVQANVELFSRAEPLSQYLATARDEREILRQPAVHRLFQSYQEAYPDYREIRLLLADGFETSGVSFPRPANAPTMETDSDFFRAVRARNGEVHAEFIADPENGELVLLAGKRLAALNTKAGSFTSQALEHAYLTISATLQFLQRGLEGNRLGKGGFLLVTDRNGHIVASPDGIALPTRIPVARFQNTVLNEDYAQIARLRLNGEDFVVDGIRAHSNLLLFALLPRAELHAAGTRLGRVLAAITLSAIALTTALLFIGLRTQLIAPIRRLGHIADEIGRGNLEVPIAVDGGDELGELSRAFHDMRENLSASHAQVQHLAYHDSVTGLPNRFMFTDELQLTLEWAEQERNVFSLLFLDLDNFKRVNDTLGHQAGDRLLQELATRLSRCVRRSDVVEWGEFDDSGHLVARVGGDEFVILLPGVTDREIVGGVAKRILGSLTRPLHLHGHTLHISASIGITAYPLNGSDASTLIKHADIAMYHAKSKGKNNFQFYDPSLNAFGTEDLALEDRLRRAIAEQELEVHFQPVVDAATQRIVSAEALVRWRDPELGLVLPDKFIPLAEETGLIVPLGSFVLTEACRECLRWQQAGSDPIGVAVNLSPVQIQRADLLEIVAEALQVTGLPPELLELELTETAILEMGEQANATLNGLNDLGVMLALDDFGTGYSSLSYLKRFAFDRLKIDRSFVSDLTKDADDAAICAAIIAMAHKLGMAVTAEGVENAQQPEQLTEWACDELQGYYFYRPMPAESMQKLVSGAA